MNGYHSSVIAVWLTVAERSLSSADLAVKNKALCLIHMSVYRCGREYVTCNVFISVCRGTSGQWRLHVAGDSGELCWGDSDIRRHHGYRLLQTTESWTTVVERQHYPGQGDGKRSNI